MRDVFAHDAVVAMDDEDDVAAPGGAITVSLCGHWEHEPPCPLAPHHTAAERDGDVVRLRVLFAAERDHEHEVRRRIDDALSRGAGWRLVSSGASEVRADEEAHGRRLASS